MKKKLKNRRSQNRFCKEKMVPTIDTVDYNKRMIAISNNDTTGRWPVKAPYPLPERYCRTTESLLLRKSIFHENGNTWRNPKGANDSKITRRVTNGMLPILR
jgi:hypothetical protein